MYLVIKRTPWEPIDLDAQTLDAALRNASKLSERWLAAPPVVMKSLVQDIVEQITVASDRIEIRLSRVNVAAALEAGWTEPPA
jgi:hypothetical protein